MNPSILITGASSGLGLALSRLYLEKDFKVFGLARKNPVISHANFVFQHCDLTDQTAIAPALHALMEETKTLKYLFLNAGIIGELEEISQTSMEQITHIMVTNVWANKHILDFFIRQDFTIEQVIATSSGASVNGNAGWGGYSLSKATLNMLIKLYAREMPDTHFCALAPGLVDTPMLRHIIENGDETRFPSLRLLKEGRKFTPEQAAGLIDQYIDTIRTYESGAYLDIRNLNSAD